MGGHDVNLDLVWGRRDRRRPYRGCRHPAGAPRHAPVLEGQRPSSSSARIGRASPLNNHRLLWRAAAEFFGVPEKERMLHAVIVVHPVDDPMGNLTAGAKRSLS